MKIKCVSDYKVKEIAEKYKEIATRLAKNVNKEEKCVNVPFMTKNGVKFTKWTYNYFTDKEREDFSQEEIIQSIAEYMASYEILNPSIKFVG